MAKDRRRIRYSNKQELPNPRGTIGYDWEIETADGKSAEIKIAGQSFEAAKGTFFVVDEDGGKVDVKQYKFSVPQSTNSSKRLIQVITEDLNIKKWIATLQKTP